MRRSLIMGVGSALPERVMTNDDISKIVDTSDDWIVERTTTLLPLCSYFSPVGSYSLRSYSLDPEKKTERVMLCHGDLRVGSYTGPCPPK